MQNTRICKLVLLVFILCGIGLSTIESIAVIPDRPPDGTCSDPNYNYGNLQDYWHVGPPDKTIFRDPKTGGIIIAKGHHNQLPFGIVGNGNSIENNGIIEEIEDGLFVFSDFPPPIVSKAIYQTDSDITIFSTNILQIKSNIDLQCNIYDCIGNSIIADVSIVGNNSNQQVSGNFEIGKPYFVVLTNNGLLVKSEIIFFNNENLFIKGK